jgi:hypothetical protein
MDYGRRETMPRKAENHEFSCNCLIMNYILKELHTKTAPKCSNIVTV